MQLDRLCNHTIVHLTSKRSDMELVSGIRSPLMSVRICKFRQYHEEARFQTRDEFYGSKQRRCEHCQRHHCERLREVLEFSVVRSTFPLEPLRNFHQSHSPGDNVKFSFHREVRKCVLGLMAQIQVIRTVYAAQEQMFPGG